MKSKEELKTLRVMSGAELSEHLLIVLKQNFDLRMQHSAEQLSDISKLNSMKKTIARIKTLIKEKENNE